ncbi:hypothetical protein SBV1_420010 [Verrucomicrobia bacterium]|nr:hypothetical protein SBV1_420010 [Verrucomicrobiota bacterium]
MSNALEILTRFLDRFGDEVEGRELREPSGEIQTQLRAFARGKLPEAQQSELLALLSHNPQWIALLAEEVKVLRGGTTATSS